VAVVSSALPYQVMPIARELGIEHVMCTHLEVADGALTGNVVHPTCYGVGKATAARDFAAPRGIKMEKSFFYTDSDEDLPLLDLVGRPRPINPNRNLATLAAKRGWPARRFTSRGTPTASEVARTALAVASAVPASLLSVPAALLAGGWRAGLNMAVSTWGELGTALAGVDLQVQGEQYLWSHRPAVFIFNHQSAVETLLLCKLLRRDFVGIAKKELEKNPIFGPIFAASGTIFVDRFNHEQAVHALEPAIAALRKGTSIVIAPEGTRSPTPTLGKFKKGAFHLAMASGRPLVPIVFKNTLDVLPKYGVVLRPATVEVVVHKPIATASWKRKDLDKHVDDVRRLFETTLAA
jgi:putative phosphoserine phosphatase/1-acylglycerol-3-phosphate O-acyltransferase